jgi:DNA-binding MarR family transcriptional regulator
MLPPKHSFVKVLLRHFGREMTRTAKPTDAADDAPMRDTGSSSAGAEEIAAIRSLLAAVDQIWQVLGASVQMGISEIVTLEALHFTSPLPTADIRARTGLSPGAVTALLDRFEARDLTRRVRPADNRRVVHVELTPTGRKLSEHLFSSLIDLLERGAHDPDLPEPSVRVQCLNYTADLLRHAAELVPVRQPNL